MGARTVAGPAGRGAAAGAQRRRDRPSCAALAGPGGRAGGSRSSIRPGAAAGGGGEHQRGGGRAVGLCSILRRAGPAGRGASPCAARWSRRGPRARRVPGPHLAAGRAGGSGGPAAGGRVPGGRSGVGAAGAGADRGVRTPAAARDRLLPTGAGGERFRWRRGPGTGPAAGAGADRPGGKLPGGGRAVGIRGRAATGGGRGCARRRVGPGPAARACRSLVAGAGPRDRVSGSRARRRSVRGPGPGGVAGAATT